jgi:hypothetical protein
MMLAFSQANLAFSHPLRLSLGEIEYFPEQRTVSISLRLFLMDVNEALVFDPESDELRFGQPDEAPHAERLLKAYLDQFFFVEVNGERLQLDIKSKTIKGQGIDAALRLSFEVMQNEPPTSIRIKNAVFTDLFFDQNNIIYVHVNGNSTSLMLNKNTPTHTLVF